VSSDGPLAICWSGRAVFEGSATLSRLRVGIVISTIRPNRLADVPAQWIRALAEKREEFDTEVLDLAETPLPFFAEIHAPAIAPPAAQAAQRWSARMAELDAYIFVLAEYLHGMPGVLKNALDYLAWETRRKPAAIVGYGALGAARGVEQLRLVLLELGMAPLGRAVHVARAELSGIVEEGLALSEFPHLEKAADLMLDELAWWALALKAGRARQVAATAGDHTR
jgi:NAD(P)H-dependent FMN reductase